jgi:threonine/homoserine/homoserine lactone efflux protein
VASQFGVIAEIMLQTSSAAAGLSALFLAVPVAYEVIKWAGALYQLWMAWQGFRPCARVPSVAV